MSTSTADRLYKLLPALYRIRDLDQGEPLRALLALVESQYDALQLDVQGLYENWFIETCQEWVVPYIGDLLAVRQLYPASPGTFSERAYVAHTLDYRRRKGTAAMLEQLVRDVTGWPARAVEFFQLLATTQYLNHLRPSNVITPDLRDTNQLELLNGPFDTIAHTADVRHIYDGRGRYNIPSLGIFLWKLQDYFIGPGSIAPTELDRQSRARAAGGTLGRFRFDPLGFDAPLFNRPRTKTDQTVQVGEINVPGMLRARPLYDELEAQRQAIADNRSAPAPVYFDENPVFQVFLEGAEVKFDEVIICDISDVSATNWRRPQPTKSYTPTGGGPPVSLNITLSVDPVRGRIAFPTGKKPKVVEVVYNYGFSGDLGAGPYDRSQWLSDPQNGPGPFTNEKRWQAAVSQKIPVIAGKNLFPTLSQAVQAWNSTSPGTDGVIAILDNGTYQEDLVGANKIVVPPGSRLLIVAADWAALRQNPPGTSIALDPNGLRPHVLGKVEVNGTPSTGNQSPGELYIDGLLMESTLTVVGGTKTAPGGNLGKLSLSHATLAPGGALTVADGDSDSNSNNALALNLYRSICGPVTLNASVTALNAIDSIIASGPASDGSAPAITAPGASVSVQTTTVFGTASARIVESSNSIFTGTVTAERRQTGCVRYSYMPPGSRTAQRYQCQPDLAIAGVKGAAAQATIEARVTPQFTSTDFGQPGYAQLSVKCAGEITSGADDGSEMGVFSFLKQPQRRANLLAALDEYLRFGLEAGMIEED